MAAPSAYTTDWPAQITTTGEANGLLLQVPPATPFGAPAVLTLMLSGTYTTGVVLVRGKLKGSGSSGVYAPISGVNVLNNAAVGTGGSFTLVNSSTNLWRFGIGAYEEIEIYASSLATGAIDVMQTVGAPDLISPPVVNATVAAVDTTTGTFSSNVTIGGTLGVTGLTTATGGTLYPDDAAATFGTGSDVAVTFNATSLAWTQVAPSTAVLWGVDGAGFDHVFNMDTASTNVTIDQSADSVIFNGAARLVFTGTTGQSEIHLTDNLADALSVEISGSTDLLTFTTTNNAECVSPIGLRTRQATAVAITGATTLTLADSGGIFTVGQGSAYDIDLPSPTTGPGCRYFFSLTAPGANNVTITVAGSAATFVGSIVSEGQIVVATGSTLTFATGAALLGDSIEIQSIATNLYHVRAIASALNGITVS